MRYRREIDGLRAVAVLPVILFHAGFTFWSGGFVGVDVFFVISGYLITTILIDERVRGSYSVPGFYERRARRILPALFVVLLACIPFAWMWVPPWPLKDFARSLAFAALSISNVHFLEHGAGYFDLEAKFRPLLHTWSLGVEEQYYLLFPLILFGIGTFARRKFLIVFALLAAVSLAVAEWGWRNYPSKNFYFTPSRLWELLAGSICAVILWRRAPMKSDALAALGLAMILFSIVWYYEGLPFPSVWTLVPVLGTVLIILFARSDTATARLLSLPPMVGVGLISYSAYLWHQPLFAFARIRGGGAAPEGLMIVLAGLSLLLAWATWRFVERPFRGRAPRLLPRRWPLFGTSAAGIAAFAAVGFWTLDQDGFEGRLEIEASPFLARLYEQTKTHPFASQLCKDARGEKTTGLCPAYVPENPRRQIALLGDSHAAVLVTAFEAVSETLGAKIVVGAYPGCPPFRDVWLVIGGKTTEECRESVYKYSEQAVAEGTDAVILAARWAMYATGMFLGDANWRTALSTTPNRTFITPEMRLAAFETGLRRTLEYYRDAGVDVVLVAQVPQQKQIPGIMVQNAMLMRLNPGAARALFDRSAVSRAVNEALQAGSREVLTRVAKEMNVPLIIPDPIFARGDRFIWFEGDDSLYMDDDHVSEVGAQRLGPTILQALRALPAHRD